jgi:hypothetical protein
VPAFTFAPNWARFAQFRLEVNMPKKLPPIHIHLPQMPPSIGLAHDAEGLSMAFTATPGTDEAKQLGGDFINAGLRLLGRTSPQAALLTRVIRNEQLTVDEWIATARAKDMMK